MAKKKKSNWDNMEPQKSSAAQFITYIASVGTVDERYEIRYEDENIWMSQKMLAAVYGVEVPNIAYHLRKLYEDAELDKASTIKEILIVAENGKNYNVKHYNLQVIIALGFKIDNERAVQFRKWANQIVSQYTIRGYVLDKPRMKDGSPISSQYFERLLEDIREIRLSERKFYQKVTDIYATAIDYDSKALRTRRFFATVQNKMHQAVNGLTAAQIIFSRADAAKEHMGLNSWAASPNGKIRKSDVVVAKNYLTEDELGMLERLVNAYLEFAENAALRHIPMTMEAWEKRLDKFVAIWDGPITIEQVENVTAAIAEEHAETEFEKYRIVQDRLFMSDYDRYLLALEEETKKSQDK
ncbi:MAG: virulence RhuM family protein [Kiritimatiellae bacterium]|nr:virulence RhuM family protein [Kiritimatiellia bacterium]